MPITMYKNQCQTTCTPITSTPLVANPVVLAIKLPIITTLFAIPSPPPYGAGFMSFPTSKQIRLTSHLVWGSLILIGMLFNTATTFIHPSGLQNQSALSHSAIAVQNLHTLGSEYEITLPLQETPVLSPPSPMPKPLVLKPHPHHVPIFHPPVKIAIVPPSPPSLPSTAIQRIIFLASQKYGVSYSHLLSVAICESGLNPNALNNSSGASGLFQFMPTTFAAHGGTNIWNPAQQANIAAHMFSAGESSAWTCR